jgi:hypothetical protein
MKRALNVLVPVVMMLSAITLVAILGFSLWNMFRPSDSVLVTVCGKSYTVTRDQVLTVSGDTCTVTIKP